MDLAIVKKTVLDFLKNQNVTVYLFGSRARTSHYSGSDIDIAYQPKENFDPHSITLLKEALENSNIPYKFDLVNLNECDEQFSKNIMKDAILWKD